MLARTPTPADASHMRGTKQHSGGVLPTLPTARLLPTTLPTTRGDKQHAGGVLPTAWLLPTTRGDKQHSKQHAGGYIEMNGWLTQPVNQDITEISYEKRHGRPRLELSMIAELCSRRYWPRSPVHAIAILLE